MSFYELVLYVHIVGAIIWIGSGFMLIVLAETASRSGDERYFGKLFATMGWLGQRLFVPASLTVLVAGIVMVIDGPWSFGELWIVLSLMGYAATFLTGVLVFEPRGKAIGAAVERDGGMTAETTAEARKVMLLSRIDYSVLFMVVAAMAIKPSGDDLLVVLAMALVIATTVVLTLSRARAMSTDSPAAPPPTAPA
jgi:uncharacterized membrane protein